MTPLGLNSVKQSINDCFGIYFLFSCLNVCKYKYIDVSLEGKLNINQ